MLAAFVLIALAGVCGWRKWWGGMVAAILLFEYVLFVNLLNLVAFVFTHVGG